MLSGRFKASEKPPCKESIIKAQRGLQRWVGKFRSGKMYVDPHFPVSLPDLKSLEMLGKRRVLFYSKKVGLDLCIWDFFSF